MKKIIIILFLLIVFLLGFLPVKDTDFGWHYRCGNQFLTTGKLCLTNEFSYFLPNYKAYYTGHLYDIILAFVYNHGGFLAVSILGAFVFTLSALVFLYLIRTDFILKVVAFFLIFFLSFSIFNLGFRPQIASFLFFLALFLILNQKNKKNFYLLPLLFIFWVNLHIGFFIGLFVLVFYFFDRKIPFVQYIVIFLLSFCTTLINPFGIYVYKEISNHLMSPLGNMIAEWVSPTVPHIILILGLGIMGFVKIIKLKPISLFRMLLLVFFAILALMAQRNIPYFYTTFAFIFFDDLKINLQKYDSLVCTLFIVVLFFIGIVFVPQTIFHSITWREYCNNSVTVAYPCKAIKSYPQLSGNVYSLYEWGGFLIWQKPNIKVFVDGRMPAWKDENGNSPYQVFLEILQTQAGWNERLRKYKTDYLFIAPGTFLDILLVKEAAKYNWKEVYRDDSAVIYQNSI